MLAREKYKICRREINSRLLNNEHGDSFFILFQVNQPINQSVD